MKNGVVLTLIAAVSVGGAAHAETTLYLKNGRTVPGKTIEWHESQQEYVVISGDTTVPVPRAQVARVVTERPAELDQAAGLARSRLYGQAIPALEGLVRKYRMLGWDAEAGKMLAQCYLDTNDPKKAVAAMENLFSVTSRDQVPASLQMTYWKALLSSGATTALRKELDKVIGSGTPDMVCAAYLVRGNMFLKTGDDDAALADFLKIVMLFQGQKAAQPEALYHVAELFDKTHDPRGAEIRKKLLQDYPGSEFASKPASKPAAAPAPAAPAKKP